MALSLSQCLSPTDPGNLVPPTADQDSKLPQVTLRIAGHSRQVHLQTFGDAENPPLLLLHGSLSDYRALLPFEALSDRYYVIMWDQRGNGLSERVTGDEYTFDSVVEEIEEIRARYAGNRPVSLIGHSFGAMYSALYMSRYPERVDQAVLVEPGGLNGQLFGDTFDQVINIDLFNPELSETYWQTEVLSPSSHEAMDYKALLLLENGHQTNYFCDADHPPRWPVWRPGAFVEYRRGKLMGAGLSGGSFEFDFAKGLDAFPRKVLLLAGSCSALGPDYQQRYHQPLFGDAEVVTIENAGHRMFVEQMDEVLDAVRGYLSQYQ
ncbi:MAG: alpha/beta hydrolase [Polyangiaceae bacterium]|nr:alpha/beta hydrolase [Myxococcales bacterium]MCB9588379.1 alpha/beta hydrolase [Polyangiaceae bacterium]